MFILLTASFNDYLLLPAKKKCHSGTLLMIKGLFLYNFWQRLRFIGGMDSCPVTTPVVTSTLLDGAGEVT